MVDTILNLLRDRPHFHELETKTHQASSSGAICGDQLSIELHIVDGIVQNAAYQGEMCALTNAAASYLIDRILHQDTATAIKIEREDLVSSLDTTIPRARLSCVQLPVDVLRQALQETVQV